MTALAGAFVRLTADVGRATDAFETLSHLLHDVSRHDPEHRASDEPWRWCFANDPVRRCAHDDCCAAATQEDFLCDRCRANCAVSV